MCVCVCVCVCVSVCVCRKSHGPDIATLHNFHLLLDLVWQTACFLKYKIEKVQLCKSTKLKKSNFAKCNRKFEKLQDGWPFWLLGHRRFVQCMCISYTFFTES